MTEEQCIEKSGGLIMKTSLIGIVIMLSITGLILADDSTSNQRPRLIIEPSKPMPMLQVTLDSMKTASVDKLPSDMIRKIEEGVEAVAKSGVLETALKAGNKAPDFELPNANGDTVKLSELLLNGPVVLTWYRGGWCPYCNAQLHAYNQALDRIKQAGGQVVAISPEVPDSSLSTVERHDLQFEVLSDKNNEVAKKYGIVYTLPKPVVDLFSDRLDLEAYNGNNTDELPLTVTYVISLDQTIQYAFVNADYRKRAEPAEVVAALYRVRAR
jgi:peroxiredoxin